MQGHYGSYQATPTASPSSGMLNLFPVQLGMDVSGIFALSIYGLAVIRPDGRAVTHRDGRLLDVSAFLLPGTNLGVYRIPADDVRDGDLIVIADSPLSLLYVLERNPVGFQGLDPLSGNIVRYTAPLSPFFNYFVRVESLFDQLVGDVDELEERAEAGNEQKGDWDGHPMRLLLPLLLLGSQGQNGFPALLTQLLLLQVLKRRV